MVRRRLVFLGMAISLLVSGSALCFSADGRGQVLAATSRILGGDPVRMASAGRPTVSDVHVDSTGTLVAALKAAQPGDVIKLAPGVYDDFGGKFSPRFDSPVTITSADPANPAVFTDFTLARAQGLIFKQVNFATLDHTDKIAEGVRYWAFKIVKSENIHFDQVHVHGSLDKNPGNDVMGIQVRDSANVSITNSTFEQLERAAAIGQTQGVNVSGNFVRDLRSDGFDFAEVINVRVVGNFLTNFVPVTGDHPDAIQFWTSGTKTASKDILISSNVIVRGEGEYVQGIFLRDQTGSMPYERVNIENNLIVGTGYNGIRIQGVKDLKLTSNELVSFAGENNTFLLIQGGDGVVATGNRAISISFDKSTGVLNDGNVITKAVDDAGAAAIRNWLEGNPSSASAWGSFLPIDTRLEPNLLEFEEPVIGVFGGTLFAGSSDLFLL